MKGWTYILLFILSPMLLPCNKLLAQGHEEEKNNLPELHDHYFVSLINLNSAFTDSQFGMSMGVAQTSDFSSIILEVDGERINGLKGSLIFADLNFHYRQKIKNWIAFDANVGLTARLGTEVQSLLAQGVNTVSSMRLGWVVKILEKDKILLSANMKVNKYNVNVISIKDFVEDLLRDSTITSISKTIPVQNIGLGVQFAWGISKLVGLQAYATTLYGDSFERGVSDFLYTAGGALDINLNTTTRVPLGFSLGFVSGSFSDIVQEKGASSTQIVFKIAYTGGQHYDLGLEFSRSKLPLRGVEEKVNTGGIFISSRYYFN